MSSICLPLPPTTRCDAWAGALINIDQLQETYSGNLHSSSSTNSSTLFTNLDFYDGLLSSYKMYKYRRSGQTFLSKIQTLLETSGLDDKTNGENYSTILDSTRYLQTFFCANDVFGWNDETKSVKYTECGDSSATSITANSHPRKLCPSMCLDAQNSLVASLTTFVKKYGIASSGTSIKDITDSFSTVCTALSSNGDVRGEGECVKQIKSESQTCGFPDNKQASLYCKLPTSIDIPCCASVIHSHQQTTSSSPSPLDSSSSSSSPAFLKGTGLSLPAFIGIVVGSGILLMIFVGVSVCLCRRRKGGRRSGRIQEQGSIKNNNNHNNSNGLGTLQRPLTLTRTSPPGLSHGAAFDHRTPTAFRTPPRNAGGGGGFSSSVNNNNNTNSTDLSSARPNRNPHLATMYPTNIKYRVTADYIPEMHDELDLRVGDIILLNVVYPDFWGFGFNEVTGLEGIVPLGLLSRIMERGK